MTELAEIKITSQYINNACENIKFNEIFDYNKNISLFKENDFYVQSFSTGKELRVDLIKDFKIIKSIFFSLGMTGTFSFCEKDKYKHNRLSFLSNGDKNLNLIDIRKFAKWRFDEDWSKNRGPCPVSEFDLFNSQLSKAISGKTNYFLKRDISEVLLDQKYFNGIGNYLRAEILYRAKILPSRNSYTVLSDSENFLLITNLCKSVAEEAIYLGGGQIKNWKNPFGKEKVNFSNWLKVYGRGENYIDKTKRRIWFN